MSGARSLTDQEVEDVLNEMKTLRDRVLWLLGVKSGLRISELLSLRIHDIMEHGQVGSQVRVAKRNTKGEVGSRAILLTVSAKTVLQQYLDSIPGYDLKQFLFQSTQGDKAISRIQAHHIFKKAFNSLKLKGNCSSHSMRKTFAIKTHKALGEKIELTQVALGHKSLSSTVHYLPVNQEVVDRAILSAG